MEKIKASDVLAMNESLTTEELKKFKFFAIDRDGRTYVYNPKPTDFINDWAFNANVNGGDFTFIKVSKAPLEWRESLREIDFSEYENTETTEIEIKSVRFNLTIEEVKVLQRKLTTILCNNEKEVQSVKDYLNEFEESDREFPEELFTPKSQMKDDISKFMIKAGLLEFVEHDNNEKIEWKQQQGLTKNS